MADTERPLKNDDFRKLLATPSVRPSNSSATAASATPAPASSHAFTHRHDKPKQKKKFRPPPKEKDAKPKDDIFDESQARLTEIMQKYRDRAEERRKGLVKDDEAELRKLAAYRVLPGTIDEPNVIDRRIQEIQESKYLGGDIEHTHLVKGLDYSLLNKVRSEAVEEPKEEQVDELEEAFKAGDVRPVVEKVSSSKFVRNVCRVLFDSELPKRNEMFARGRMAYIVELDDDESDVPTTLMRSLKDCPADTSSEHISADNLLINKLTQVLSYLRSSEGKKQKRRAEGGAKAERSDDKIYDEADDYVPSRHKDKHSHSDSRRDKPSSYFDGKHDDRRDDRDDRDRRRDRDHDSGRGRDRDDRDRSRRDDRDRRRDEEKPKDSRWPREEGEKKVDTPAVEAKPKKRKFEEEDAYAELFPGGLGMIDAGGESDDEADYSKMDMGNRKGPVKRWDFENEEDYEKYQSGREAMPKAAYQYGVKAAAGRKTRKNNAQEEKKIDRELNKINKILDDRKKHGIDADVAKRIRY